jgi:glycosyltransferase involved in cell wall biosynthesis
MAEGPHRSIALQTVALLGSYVPRQCGIATFTKDLRDAVAAEIGERQATALAIDDTAAGYDYPAEVRFQIPQHKQAEYVTAADLLNINQIDAVLIQHEYGIYGGKDGSQVLELVRQLRMPVITTLHTVLQDPSPGQRSVLKELTRLSDRVVVMSHKARAMLQEIYQVAPERIAYIPHGIPDVPFVEPELFKDRFGLEGRRVLLTFGLLSPGKGIEVAIKAMPRIVARHPDVMYIILGTTHPHVLKNQGNAYRSSLERLVDQLRLDDNVVFHNRFVGMEELLAYLRVADVYITAYPNAQQITSGTLSYAVGAGKAVVSTPYWHAQELLADGRGRFFPFNDTDALAAVVNGLLDDESARAEIRRRAYQHGRPMIWKEVARSYLLLAGDVIKERQRRPKPVVPSVLVARAEASEVAALPDVNLSHLRRMTDYTGMLQHAIYAIPDRHHGYSTDDNARALVAALMYYDLSRDDSVLPLADVYFSFIRHAFDPADRRFRNFMSYDRRWLDEAGSEDVHGRTVWALGSAAMLAPSDAVWSLAHRMFHEAIEVLESFTSPRAWAFALVGMHHYLEKFGGDTPARRVRDVLARRLFDQFVSNRGPDWPWCEDSLTYDNAKLPHALILCGQDTADPAMLDQGLRSLDWLVRSQIVGHNRVSLIGNRGWLDRAGHRARFDQQPIEAMALVTACAQAYRVTGEEAWFDRCRTFLDWFTGNNEIDVALYDFQTGGCRDGLHAGGPNFNQGAESTLAWLISLFTMMDLHRARIAAEHPAQVTSPPATPDEHRVSLEFLAEDHQIPARTTPDPSKPVAPT